MNAFITFLLFISFLNDLFEFSCNDILALSCTAPAATVSSPAAATRSDLIFTKAVMFPEAFIKFAWSLISFILVAPSFKHVATALVLAAAAVLCLIFQFSFKTTVEKPSEPSFEDAIEMVDISSSNTKTRKPSNCSRSESVANRLKDINCLSTVKLGSYITSPYSVYVGYLFNEASKSSALKNASPCLVYLGSLFSEEAKPVKPSTAPYEVNLADLFDEATQCLAAPDRRISYADAVGYEKMEVRKPRNPDVIGYDVYLGDLFFVEELESVPIIEALVFEKEHETEGGDPQNIVDESSATVHRYSFASLKARKAYMSHENIFSPSASLDTLIAAEDATLATQSNSDNEESNVSTRKYSFASLKAQKAQKELKEIFASKFSIEHLLASVDGLDYIDEQASLSVSHHVINKLLSFSDLFTIEEESISPSQIFTPKYPLTLGDFFSFESKAPVSQIKEMIDESPRAENAEVRHMSYADAVGYANMETRRPVNPDAVCYDVYLADLFSEPKQDVLAHDLNTSLLLIDKKVMNLSYADAVGYEFMEQKYPRNIPSVGYDVYLGDLFVEPEQPFIVKKAIICELDSKIVLNLITLIQSNIKFYITSKLAKSIFKHRFNSQGCRNGKFSTSDKRFMKPKLLKNIKKLY